MKEYVRHPLGSPSGEPFDDRTQVELEEKPTQLMMATHNNVGLDVSNLLQTLGFVQVEGESAGDLFLRNTPKKIFSRDWAISYQKAEKGEKRDLNIFTIYLNHGSEVGYMDFLRQITNRQGRYCVFFP
ncbi:hypothetical protein HYW46_02500 [Candidatus Daviesbacteria bacterium]|nr:hypothetical protein [Candidatus Daviesbacteria bacterium]